MVDLGRAESISIDRLQLAIGEAAKSHSDLIRGETIPGWLRDPGILGLILRDVDFASLDMKRVNAVSEQIATSSGAGKAISAIIDGNLIIGVLPFETTFSR